MCLSVNGVASVHGVAPLSAAPHINQQRDSDRERNRHDDDHRVHHVLRRHVDRLLSFFSDLLFEPTRFVVVSGGGFSGFVVDIAHYDVRSRYDVVRSEGILEITVNVAIFVMETECRDCSADAMIAQEEMQLMNGNKKQYTLSFK